MCLFVKELKCTMILSYIENLQIAKSFDARRHLRTAQADMGQYFFAATLKPPPFSQQTADTYVYDTVDVF